MSFLCVAITVVRCAIGKGSRKDAKIYTQKENSSHAFARRHSKGTKEICPHLFLIFLRLWHQCSNDLDFAQILERPGRIAQLEINFFRMIQLQLRQTQLCSTHKIILQTPVVVKDL